ncbi:MAG: carbohydrate binding domain-containing protein [Planctomycetota bacterium]
MKLLLTNNTRPRKRRGAKRFRRRGTAYIIVLGASLLIATFAMAGILSIRVERNSLRDSLDRQQAIYNAQAGLDLALYKIRENRSSWRNLDWDTTVFSADSRFSLALVDPVDGDLTDSAFDPVVLIASGLEGDTVQKLRIRLEPEVTGYDSMQSALHSAADIQLDQTTLAGSGEISADNLVDIRSSSTVSHNTSSSLTPVSDDSSTFQGKTGSTGTWPRSMPSSSSVVSAYSSGATRINLASLYLSDHDDDRITNSVFSNLTGWTAMGCQLAEGVVSAYVTKRTGDDTGIAQDVTSLIYSGDQYRLEAWVKNLNRDDCKGFVHLRVESTGSGVQFFSSPSVECKSDEWTRVTGDVSPAWTGDITSVHWMVTMTHDTEAASAIEYQVYDPDLFDRTYPDQAYVLRNQLLTPQSNPFGVAPGDDAGVYILDCAGNQVIITDSRLNGTLVLENSANASITGSVSMESAGRSYPVIVAADSLSFDLAADSLEESAIRTNLNPTGSPFSRLTDTDQSDSYPSKMRGIVYIGGKLVVGGSVTVDGVVLAADFSAANATFNLNYDERYYLDPPPGFRDDPDMVVAPGGIRQYVD